MFLHVQLFHILLFINDVIIVVALWVIACKFLQYFHIWLQYVDDVCQLHSVACLNAVIALWLRDTNLVVCLISSIRDCALCTSNSQSNKNARWINVMLIQCQKVLDRSELIRICIMTKAWHVSCTNIHIHDEIN